MSALEHEAPTGQSAIDLTHIPVSCHGPTGFKCEFCAKPLRVGDDRQPCPKRAKVEDYYRVRDAAPDLLAALVECLPQLRLLASKLSIDDDVLEAIAKANAAIAKAIGA